MLHSLRCEHMSKRLTFGAPFYVAVIFLFCIFSNVQAQNIHSVQVEFTRSVKSDNEVEITEGTIYFKVPQKITVKISTPLNQWMQIEGTQTLIYYPDREVAFALESETTVVLPFFLGFLNATLEDFGLTKVGYHFVDSKLLGDTLIARWEPPEEVKEFLGTTYTGFARDRLVFVENTNPEGSSGSRAEYSNHFKYRGMYFPLEIKVTNLSEEGSFVENIVFKNPQFNEDLPPEAFNLNIPVDIEIRKGVW